MRVNIRRVATPEAEIPVGLPEGQAELPVQSVAPSEERRDAAAAPAVALTPIASLWRMREYLRPYFGQLVFMLLAALIGAGTEIAIPLLTKAAIDGPIASSAAAGPRHGYGLLIPLGLGAIALGISEVIFSLIRRWIQ